MPRDARVDVTSARRRPVRAAVGARASGGCRPLRPGRRTCRSSCAAPAQASRQVNNFCTPDAFEADELIAVEVLTPGGNWSSYPPHKHDEDRPSARRVLEEIYYFEVADGPAGRASATSGSTATAGTEIDVLAEVRTGDVVLIPHGWHGPSMAAPGYDLYYLNVMAGPGDERAWRICDDPAHAWVRDTWADQAVDPRLPFGDRGGRSR